MENYAGQQQQQQQRIANSTNLDAIKTEANLWHAFSNKVITHTHPHTHTRIHSHTYLGLLRHVLLLGFPFRFAASAISCLVPALLRFRAQNSEEAISFVFNKNAHNFVAHNLVTIRAR